MAIHTPVLLPGKSHGQRSLVGYSPWGRKESDTTERLHFTSSISSTSIRTLPFLSCIFPVLAYNVPLVSPVFLNRSHPSHSVVFLYFYALFMYLFLLGVLWNSAFSWVYLSHSLLPFAFLLSSVICKASSTNQFAFLHFFFFGMPFQSLPPVQCYKPLSIVLQALYQM